MKIFQIIVIPNIAITAEEKDDYEDDPEQFIRNDLEEADLETRRRNCLKFVQKLSKLFQNQIGELVGNYIGHFQQEYNANREANWEMKTSIVNLLIAVSIQHYSFRLGVVDLTITDNQLQTYIAQMVVPEL